MDGTLREAGRSFSRNQCFSLVVLSILSIG